MNRFIYNISLVLFLLGCSSFIHGKNGHLKKVLSSQSYRHKFSGFIDNVIGTVSSDNFYKLVETVCLETNPQSDDQLYASLLKKVNSVLPWFHNYHLIQTLKSQKKFLALQAASLIGEGKVIDGIVEVGTPGTYVSELKHKVTITGTIYAVTDKERLSDYAQANSRIIRDKFLGYHKHIPLSDYAPIDPLSISSASVDLVICTIGLHHIPREKLDNFVGSIKRILRPGGLFILRDHDCRDSLVLSLADAAHSVFNIIVQNGPISIEKEELRNFQPLSYWIDLLSRHGLEVGTQRLRQAGDPTLNTLIKYTKCATNQDFAQQEVMHAMHNQKGVIRDQATTYLNAPEWYNVDAAQEYSAFIDHTPWYEFPWLKHISTFWQIFGRSWRAAAQEVGHLNVITSIDTLTNLFIGVTMSIEYGAKSCLSLPIRWLFNGQDPTTVCAIVQGAPKDIVALDSRITIEKNYPEAGIVQVNIPRYKEFGDIVINSAQTDLVFLEIGGHKKIVFKVRSLYSIDTCFCSTISGCTKLYDWNVPTQQQYTYTALCVSVENIGSTINILKKNNIEIMHIHDL